MKNRKLTPVKVYGETVVEGTVSEVATVFQNMLNSSKVKTYQTNNNTIYVEFKINWFGISYTAENIYKRISLTLEPINEQQTKINYAFQMRNSMLTLIFGSIAAALFFILGIGMLVAGMSNSGMSEAITFGWVTIGLGVFMAIVALFGWNAKRQIRLFNKQVIEKVQAYIYTVRGQSV